MYSCRKEHGASLIEIMISVLIISVGLLGVASLQFVGSFSNSQAASRTQASVVVAKVMEELSLSMAYSDSAGGWVPEATYFSNDVYNFSGLSCASDDNYTCYCLEIPASIPNCRNNTCSPSELAKFSSWSSSCDVVAVHPNALLEVSCTDSLDSDGVACSPGSRIKVMVSWPATGKQGIESQTGAGCGGSSSSPKACVIEEIFL